MILIDEILLKRFRNSIGLFAIVDYSTPGGVATAKGRLASVSDNGSIIIEHLDNPQISWGFNIEDIDSYKFSPIKERGSNSNIIPPSKDGGFSPQEEH